MENREPKGEEGRTTGIALTESNKAGDLEDGVQTQIVDLDLVEREEAAEEGK
jgi:hypothetical protein